MPFLATWMDLKIIILSEVSQTHKDKYIIFVEYDIFVDLHVESKK